MPTFPTPFSGSSALYPATRTSAFSTTVIRFSDTSEQRWSDHSPLTQWTLSLDGIDESSVDSIRSFFDSVKGGKDSFDLSIGGVTYGYMVFASDDLDFRADGANWSATIQLTQLRKT